MKPVNIIQRLNEDYIENYDLEEELNKVWFDYCASLRSFESAKRQLQKIIEEFDVNEIREWFEGTVCETCYSKSIIYDVDEEPMDMKEEISKIFGNSDESK